MSEKNPEFVSREHMETQVSLARVQAVLDVHRDDFLTHATDDKSTFNEIFSMQRAIREELHEIPKKITSCRDQIENKIHQDIKENFVTKNEFDRFSNKITYTLSGIVLFGIFVTWILTNISNIHKIFGG